MKINPIGSNGYFVTKPAGSPGAHRENPAEQAPAKMDTIVISRGGAAQNAYTPLVRKLAGEVISHDSPARVEELRRAIDAGTYRVSSQAVADAILSHGGIQ